MRDFKVRMRTMKVYACANTASSCRSCALEDLKEIFGTRDIEELQHSDAAQAQRGARRCVGSSFAVQRI